MKIKEINENAEREYVNLPKDDIERLRAKFLPDWEYKDNSLQKRYKKKRNRKKKRTLATYSCEKRGGVSSVR